MTWFAVGSFSLLRSRRSRALALEETIAIAQSVSMAIATNPMDRNVRDAG